MRNVSGIHMAAFTFKGLNFCSPHCSDGGIHQLKKIINHKNKQTKKRTYQFSMLSCFIQKLQNYLPSNDNAYEKKKNEKENLSRRWSLMFIKILNGVFTRIW